MPPALCLTSSRVEDGRRTDRHVWAPLTEAIYLLGSSRLAQKPLWSGIETGVLQIGHWAL
jgi:hypothetical protein